MPRTNGSFPLIPTISRELRRFNPSLGVRDLLLYDPRVFSLADIDVVGLQPVASLLISRLSAD